MHVPAMKIKIATHFTCTICEFIILTVRYPHTSGPYAWFGSGTAACSVGVTIPAVTTLRCSTADPTQDEVRTVQQRHPGDGPGLIPGSGRSSGEGIKYPLQYSWASLVAQLVKNPAAMWETWVWSLDWEDPLEKGKATHSRILAWRIPWTIQSMKSQRVGQDWATFTFMSQETQISIFL